MLAVHVAWIQFITRGNDTTMQNIERIVLRTENTTVVATDQPTHGNACHKYEVRDPMGGLLGSFHFQEGPIKEAGINGVQHAELLAIIRDRLDGFQVGKFASGTNEVTRGFVDAAMASDATRTRLRAAAGVEGTSKA